MCDNRIYLHDPAGFAHVFIHKEDLPQAWRAEGISYRRGHYRYWAAPRRCTRPSQSEIHEKAFITLKRLYTEADHCAEGDALRGCEAIRLLAELVSSNSLSELQQHHLIAFALPLGAKRALDYARFFGGRDDELAALKRDQATDFGACLTHLVMANWKEAGQHLEKLAASEERVSEKLRA